MNLFDEWTPRRGVPTSLSKQKIERMNLFDLGGAAAPPYRNTQRKELNV